MEQGEQEPGSPEFGTLLRRYRLAASLSQEALAERARLSVNGLSSLERGARRNPRRETLALLSDALELNAAERRQFELAAALSSDARRGPSVTVGPWPERTVPSLPLALTSFVGRDTELVEIGALVRAHRMVTLTGAGGVGKTQTALHVASSIDDSDWDFACFVGLAPVMISEQVVGTIASTLGVQEVPNRPLLDTLTRHLRRQALLLILDNCEHVLTEVAIAAEILLTACPRIRILATSREPLRAAGEYIYKLPTLSFPSLGAPRESIKRDARTFGSVALFTDRASAVDNAFVLTDDNAPIVAEICRRLDGIPLAVELAAARVNQLTLKTIAANLDECFLLLSRGSRTAPPRQLTMHATIEWSYNLLSAKERLVFERLSIFAGGCTLETATTVCGDDENTAADIFDALSSLVEKSLLTADSDNSETRYVVFESFRQYAAIKLAERGEHDMVALRHARTYHELARRSGADPYTSADPLPRERIEEELDNWRAALHWTLNDRGDILLGQQLAGRSFGIWRDRSIEGRRWINSAIRSIDERTPESVIADLRFAEAFVAWQLWECETELAAGQAALHHYRAARNSLGIARSQDLTAHALINLGRNAEAKMALLEGIELAQEIGDLPLVAFMLRNLASASSAENDIIAARDYLARARSIYQALPDTSGDNALRIAWTTSDRALIEADAGNVETALGLITELLDAPRISSWWRVISNVLIAATYCLTLLGRYDEAERYALEALAVHRRHRLQPATGWLLQQYAMTISYRPHASAERMHSSHVRAAKILGFVNASLPELGTSRTPAGVLEYGQILNVLRSSLDPGTLAKQMFLGAAMDEDAAAELMLQTAT
jgi:predicted ATPase/transcriptional regulator with XRE-family HTH domain